MHNRKLHRIANDQRLAKGAEGANPHKEEANTDRAGLKHPFGSRCAAFGSHMHRVVSKTRQRAPLGPDSEELPNL